MAVHNDQGPKSTSFAKSTILSHRHYSKVCFICLIAYFILHAAIGLDHIYSPHPICPLNVTHAAWTRDISLVVSGFFVASVGLQINRMCLSTFREENDIGTFSAYFASLCVNLIASCSHTSTLFFNWGGTCEDAFGVQTSGGHWPEWLVGVPLLVFIVLSVDDKPMLSRSDLLIIGSLFLCIFFGVLIQTTKDPNLASTFFFCSVLFCAPCLYMVYCTHQELLLVVQRATNQSRKGVYQRKVLLASRKATLGFGLGVLLPVFGVIYLCAIQKIFSPDLTYVAFNTYSAFTKVFFASLCMDAHLEISHPAIGLIDKENFSSASRRAFLRYVFHEMRVPLNSISLGLQVLSDTTTTKSSLEQEKETISLMKEASLFMSDILNDVMALQRIEEGSLELAKNPFSLKELFRTIEDSFAEMSQDLDVRLFTYIEESLADKLLGDKFRIGHVLANLTSNALKFSYPKGKVVLTAEEAIDMDDFISVEDDEWDNALKEKRTSGKGRKTNADKVGARVLVKFRITDEGRGISEEDQADDIFTPFRNLKHGELERSRGSGLGLAICRELVHMHGGKIYYTSTLGKGSTFNVVFPLRVYAGKENLSSANKAFIQRLHSFRSHSHVIDSPVSSPHLSLRPGSASSRDSSHNLGVISPDDDDVFQSFSPGGISRGGSTSPMPSQISSLSHSNSAYGQFAPGIAFQRKTYARRENGSPTSPFQDMHPDANMLSSLDVGQSDKQDGVVNIPAGLVLSGDRSLLDAFHMAEQNRVVLSDGEARQLPPAAGESPQILSRVPSAHEIGPSGEDKKSLQALVVDDVLSNRKLLALLLVKKGMTVQFAENGKICLEIVRSMDLGYFDIIFMDNTMPIMTGIEATRELRKRGFHKLIVGVTGNAMTDELNDFLNSGADIVITKPMRLQLLDQVIALIEESGCDSNPDMRIQSKDDVMVWVPRKATRR